MIIVTGSGAVYPGETDQVLLPRHPSVPGYPVLIIHGAEAGAGAIDWMTASPYRWPIIRAVVDRCGLSAMSADLGGNATWGNSTVRSRIDAMFVRSQSIPGTRQGKVILVGQSMGGLAALVWAAANPGKVAGLIGVIPVTNLAHAHASSYGPAINAAYGGSYTDEAYGTAHNPVMFAARLAGVRGRLYAGEGDTLARLVDAEAIAVLSGSIDAVAIAGGHQEATLANVPLDDMVQFLQSCAREQEAQL